VLQAFLSGFLRVLRQFSEKQIAETFYLSINNAYNICSIFLALFNLFALFYFQFYP